MHHIVAEGTILVLTIGDVILRREAPKNLGGQKSSNLRWLNNITVRRIRKVTVHCFLSLIVVQAQALNNVTTNQASLIRQCVHMVV